ncbi:hypothetical protein Tsubulata_001611 [Turnera subulata]|uniref:Glycosyltransferase n=1 Tax=Turnera subulata TaxID=218843 RepID=A0A9Q0IWE0_9ROSI|nr:hypothetical protein Tsubulata_001611 [Turnera subulata]
MKKTELIFVPAPGAGHLVSTLEFAKRLLDQDDQLLITLLLIKMPASLLFIDSYVKSLTASQPRIQVIDLPEVEPPPMEILLKSPEYYFCEFIESCLPHVKDMVSKILSSAADSTTHHQVAGLVIDFFCVSMIDIANEAGLPSFIFLTSNAGFLGLMMHLPNRHQQISSSAYKMSDSDDELLIPGIADPVSPRVLPIALFNEHGGYTSYVKLSQRFKDAKGIIVNTFAELEAYAVEYFVGDVDDHQTPAVYPVGPVLNLKSLPHPDLDLAQWHKTMKWLDEQPQSSVVFLCFGSGSGSFSALQVKELALGLEQSGDKFLWSIRVPPSTEFKNPEEMLPDGFLERVHGRGMICGWTAQVEVLAHKAIGGFVSHCGWNSILESLWFGVPIVTFPIYAEQQLNAFRMVKELGLAVELRSDHRIGGDPVMADEIARAVKSVMQSDDGGLRKRVQEMGDKARKAVMNGGSSFLSIRQFLNDIKGSA